MRGVVNEGFYCIINWIEPSSFKITRGHNFTLVKKQSRLDVRKFSFSPEDHQCME